MSDDLGTIVTRQVDIARGFVKGGLGVIDTDRTIADLADRLEVMTRRALSAEQRATDAEGSVRLYDSAWLRALGGEIYNKSHRIDGLAYTTKNFREKALKFEATERAIGELTAHSERADKRAEWLGRVMGTMERQTWEALGLNPEHLTLDDAIDAKLNEE